VDGEMENISRQKLSVPLGAITGSRIFSGWGPDINFRAAAEAAASVRVEDSFLSAGINQTLHSVYLHISVDLQVIAPLSRDSITVDSTVLLAEAVIVGYTPDTYVVLENSPSEGK